jgi:hypothetical protein
LREFDSFRHFYEGFKVSVCIGQDYKFVSDGMAVGKKMADVGSLLGFTCIQEANQNIGDVEERFDGSPKMKNGGCRFELPPNECDNGWGFVGLGHLGYIVAIRYAGYEDCIGTTTTRDSYNSR